MDLRLAGGESEPARLEVVHSLAERKLDAAEFAVIDGNPGSAVALSAQWRKLAIQRCYQPPQALEPAGQGSRPCENYGTHKHPAVRRWVTAHPRFHLHFTPTSASRLNLVERWFALITGQAIRRGSFDTVARFECAIMRWLEPWNDPQRFLWAKSAAAIKRSLFNVTAICETQHWRVRTAQRQKGDFSYPRGSSRL